MGKFRVLGSRTLVYYTEVEAPNASEAYDIAETVELHNWNPIEDDYVMEVLEVLPVEEEDNV